MPLLIIPLALLLAVLALVLLLPFSLVQRYRLGTARRQARGWTAGLNAAGLGLSAFLFLASAAVTSRWVPGAFTYALAGLGAGAVLGLLSLALTRWDVAGRTLHYTPNRVLVLALVVTVAGRVVYGFWRGWHAWRAAPHDLSWLASSGAAGSLAAGALVLGYYFIFWTGVQQRARRHRRAHRLTPSRR